MGQEALEVLATFGGPIPDDEAAFEEVRDAFGKMDLDKNGYIDFNEFKNCCEMLGIDFHGDSQVKKDFDAVDVDYNGKISEEEFLSWWKKGGRLQEQIAKKVKFSIIRDENDRAVGTAF